MSGTLPGLLAFASLLALLTADPIGLDSPAVDALRLGCIDSAAI